MKQTAEVMVHSYPKMPVLEDMFNTFAAERGFPDAEATAAGARPQQAQWEIFWSYTKLVDPDYTMTVGYVPLDAAAGNHGSRSVC